MKLSTTDALGQILSRDMAGDPDWQLTETAKYELARMMAEVAEKEKRRGGR